MKPKLTWEKHSWKRFGAKVGPLTIEIRFISFSRQWGVGEVFGANRLGSRTTYAEPEEAMVEAELVAEKALRTAQAAMPAIVSDLNARYPYRMSEKG